MIIWDQRNKERKETHLSFSRDQRKTLDNSTGVENFKYRNSNKKSTVEKLQELKIVSEVERVCLPSKYTTIEKG